MSDYTVFYDDIPENFKVSGSVAIDTETMGLVVGRDRLCLVQFALEDGSCYFVKVSQDIKKAHNFCAILEDESVQKIFHFARFDVAILQHTYCVKISNIYCTKIASKLTRTYTEKHGLKELCKELLSVDLSKEQQSSYWGADSFSKEQLKYAANDVLYLHALKARLNILLEREKRLDLAHECFRAIPVISTLDSLGFNDLSVLEH